MTMSDWRYAASTIVTVPPSVKRVSCGRPVRRRSASTMLRKPRGTSNSALRIVAVSAPVGWPWPGRFIEPPASSEPPFTVPWTSSSAI